MLLHSILLVPSRAFSFRCSAVVASEVKIGLLAARRPHPPLRGEFLVVPLQPWRMVGLQGLFQRGREAKIVFVAYTD